MAGNHVIGATLTLRDNMSAALRKVRSELSAFSRDTETTRRALDRMARQRNEVRIDTTSALRSISRIRESIEPLRNRVVIRATVQDDASGEIRRIHDETAALGNQTIAPEVRIRDKVSSAVKGIKSKFEALEPLTSKIMALGPQVLKGATDALESGATLEQQQLVLKHSVSINNPNMNAADAAGISADFLGNLKNNASDTHILTSDVVSAGASAVSITGGDTTGAMELVKLSEDMAALNPGKTISEAMEALAGAKNGSMEGLQGFGVSIGEDEFKSFAGRGKNDDMSEADTNTAFGMLVDKKLKPSFKGGTAEQADTGLGLVNAVKGKTGSLIQDTGLKMLERLKPAIKSVVALIDQCSPQIEKLALKIADGIESIVNKATLVYNFFKTNWATLRPFIEGIAIAFGAVTAAQLALNIAMSINPIGLIVLGIGLLIGGLILLHDNFDAVKAKVDEVGVAIKNRFIECVNGAIDLINGLIGAIREIPGFGGIPLIGKIALDTSNNSTADGMQAARSHANGLDYVPYDGYIAELHKGERVQRASENPYNGARSSSSVSGKSNEKSISIAKLADTIIVREDADIDRIANALLLKIDETALNMT
ncbi:hypothetical protein REC12_25415 [Desulfosporosinus sp. PR]|uniref:hypothetical protein n=1 Tax=Candidatus Desulfosporosinus nitrosoreducens TaxID=3401928 RepID=UPI0027F79870|nr:hypothetical protein [Desulfosporosinus sp. PR]MDQ7096939.1 hypothetical protein [Desulfosporosinus sp. PR]